MTMKMTANLLLTRGQEDQPHQEGLGLHHQRNPRKRNHQKKKQKRKSLKKKIRYVAKRKLCDVLILLYFGNILYLIAIYSYLFLSILQPKGKWGGSRRRYTDRDMRRAIDLVRE
ncbi:unnamed protein product [Meganyctiphanes norvegica]|uniref:Transmembrane protein n=1 Tax=Meganyctiphanes norvegica TaxID=48144 RepID=A0AAV2QC16_MEGNR